MRYKFGVAIALTAGAVLISGAIGSPLPSTDHEAISTEDRLANLENTLAQLGEENDRLRADLNHTHSKSKEIFENQVLLNEKQSALNLTGNELSLSRDEMSCKAILRLEYEVQELARCQAVSAFLMRWLFAGGSIQEGDGIWLQRAEDVLERSMESLRRTEEIHEAEMKLYQHVFGPKKRKERVKAHHIATINSAVERWYIVKEYWPALDLSDIGADVNYFPEGISTSPVDGHQYTLDPTTHQIR